MKSNILYIIESKSGVERVVKIGITNNLTKRLKAIQTGNPEKLELAHIEEVPSYINIVEFERWLHSVFGEDRKNGEWFSNLTVKEIRKMIFRFLIK